MARHVEGAKVVHDLEGMVVAEHDHVGQQFEPIGGGADIAQRRHRIPVSTAAWWKTGPGAPQCAPACRPRETGPLGGHRDGHDVLDRAVDLPLGRRTGD